MTNIKFTKHVTLTSDEIKDIIIKHLHKNFNLSGIFDIQFNIGKKSYPSIYAKNCNYDILTGADVKISENENIQTKNSKNT